MTYPQQSFGGHPVAGFLHAASADAAKVADMPLWSLSDAEVGELLTVAARVEAQVAALKLGLVAEAHARDLAGRAGVPSTQAWLRSQLRVTPQAAKGQVTLAGALRGLDATRVALAEGRVSVAHARVVADAVAELPEQVGDQVRERAESHLVGCAGEFDPQQLAKLGRRIFEVVDPDTADAREAEKLADQQQRAWRRREVSFIPDGHGTVFVRGRLDTESAAVVRRALDPLAKPRPSGPDGPDGRSAGARTADAWVELSRRALAGGDLPLQRGERPQLVVTIDHDRLRDQAGVGVLDTGEQLPPGEVRRLACDAQVLPAVLGSDSTPLDLGRTVRLFTASQRRALILRDKGCAFPGCDRPPQWTEAHHLTHWINGGASDLHNAILLCGFHHREIHKGYWRVRIASDGHPEFTPPRYVDPAQHPIRNRMHRPRFTRPECNTPANRDSADEGRAPP